jgi:hypothetical protein
LKNSFIALRRCRKYDSWPLVGQVPAPNESNCLQGGRNFLIRADSWRAILEAFGDGGVVRTAETYPGREEVFSHFSEGRGKDCPISHQIEETIRCLFYKWTPEM